MQVRNKFWRCVLRYSCIHTGTGAVTGPSGKLRQQIYVLMNDQTSSRGAYLVSALINVAIITSTLSYIYSSLPEYRMYVAKDPYGTIPAGIYWHDLFCAVVFTIELILRLVSLPSFAALRSHPSIFLDVAAVAPWYIETISGHAIAFFSVLRVARSVRMLMIFQATQNLLSLLGGTAQRAANMLGLLVCVITMWICVLGVTLWAFERGDWDPDRRMFALHTSWECPVTCPQEAHFGPYGGCRFAGDEVMMNVGYRRQSSLQGCTSVKVRSCIPQHSLTRTRMRANSMG